MIPDAPAPAPVAMPQAPKEPSKSIEPQMVQPVKADKYLWAKVAVKSVDPNNAPVPPPRKMTRDDAPASDDLPSRDRSSRSSLRRPRRGPQRRIRARIRRTTFPAEAARSPATIAARRCLRRSCPTPSLTAELPAAQGGLPGSRLDNQSNVPVDGTDGSHCALGPEHRVGGERGIRPRGVTASHPPRRDRRPRPGRAFDRRQREFRSRRASAPVRPVRTAASDWRSPPRRLAVQSPRKPTTAARTRPPVQAERLPRTAAEMGVLLPSATAIAGDSGLAGAGGAAARPGGQTSRLEVGQNISVRRVAGSGTPAEPARAARQVLNSGAGDVPLNAVASAGSALPGMGAPRPRRIEQGTNEGDDHRRRQHPPPPQPASGCPGFRSSRRDRITSGPVAGTAAAVQGPVQGAGRIGPAAQAVGPQDSLGGTDRLYGPGQRIGDASRRTRSSRLKSRRRSASPLCNIAASRNIRRPSDGQLDEVLSGEGPRSRWPRPRRR